MIDHKRFEETGQRRPPKKGEWYRSITGEEKLARKDFESMRPAILRRVDEGPREPEEIERDTQQRAASRQEQKAGSETGEPAEGEVAATPERQERRSSSERAGAPTTPYPARPLAETARQVAREYLPYTDDEED